MTLADENRPFVISCECGRRYRISPGAAPGTKNCAECGGSFVVPAYGNFEVPSGRRSLRWEYEIHGMGWLLRAWGVLVGVCFESAGQWHSFWECLPAMPPPQSTKGPTAFFWLMQTTQVQSRCGRQLSSGSPDFKTIKRANLHLGPTGKSVWARSDTAGVHSAGCKARRYRRRQPVRRWVQKQRENAASI